MSGEGSLTVTPEFHDPLDAALARMVADGAVKLALFAPWLVRRAEPLA